MQILDDGFEIGSLKTMGTFDVITSITGVVPPDSASALVKA